MRRAGGVGNCNGVVAACDAAGGDRVLVPACTATGAAGQLLPGEGLTSSAQAAAAQPGGASAEAPATGADTAAALPWGASTCVDMPAVCGRESAAANPQCDAVRSASDAAGGRAPADVECPDAPPLSAAMDELERIVGMPPLQNIPDMERACAPRMASHDNPDDEGPGDEVQRRGFAGAEGTLRYLELLEMSSSGSELSTDSFGEPRDGAAAEAQRRRHEVRTCGTLWVAAPADRVAGRTDRQPAL